MEGPRTMMMCNTNYSWQSLNHLGLTRFLLALTLMIGLLISSSCSELLGIASWSITEMINKLFHRRVGGILSKLISHKTILLRETVGKHHEHILKFHQYLLKIIIYEISLSPSILD
jgi:hypothetical protein